MTVLAEREFFGYRRENGRVGWGLVSETHSRLDIDYPAYTNDNAARFEAALRSYKSHL